MTKKAAVEDPKKGRNRGNAGKGRPPGSQNKVTATVKMMVLGALDALGGEEWLVAQAKKHPQAFMQMLRQVMPTQVVGDVTHRYVAELPPPENDPQEWLTKYSPKPTTHSAPTTRQ
jgi:hypothetical protein